MQSVKTGIDDENVYIHNKLDNYFELTNDKEETNNGTGSLGPINNTLEGKGTDEGPGISNLRLSENGEQSEGAYIANSEWTGTEGLLESSETNSENDRLKGAQNNEKVLSANPSCPSVAKMKESNKWYYHGTRDELINQGYKPCGNCHP